MRNAVGFYWTLPVPWAGFTDLPKTIEDAARASRTIRYQCDLIRRYARDENFRLVAEEVFLEIEPDRASQYVREPLRRVEKICRAHDAWLLYVDFSLVHGWRSHGPLTELAERQGIQVADVHPSQIMIDGKMFDPHVHFSRWRERQDDWTAGKEDRTARARDAAQELRAEKRTNKSIAEELNARHVRSASGKPWTEDSIRKLLGPHPRRGKPALPEAET